MVLGDNAQSFFIRVLYFSKIIPFELFSIFTEFNRTRKYNKARNVSLHKFSDTKNDIHWYTSLSVLDAYTRISRHEYSASSVTRYWLIFIVHNGI